MFCTHCGKDIGEGVKFCPFCGTKQDESNNEGIGDKIGRQIDDAVNDFEGEFKQFEDSAGKAFENASDGFRQTQEKADDIRKNWRDYMTPEYYEKFAAFAPILPFFMGIVVFAFSRIFFFLYFIPVIGTLLHTLIVIIKLIFLICTGAGVGAAAYQIANYQNKKNTWSYLTLAADFMAFLSCLGSIAGWHGLSAFLGFISLVIAIDTISRVLLQNKGIESEPDLTTDINEYKKCYKNYQDNHSNYDADNNNWPESYFDGDGITLFGLSILTGIVSAVTCGIATPWMLCKVYKWRKTHTVIDGRRLDFDGDGASLLGNWIVWEILSFITCGIYLFFLHVALRKWELKHTFYADDPTQRGVFDGNSLQYVGYGIIQDLVLLVTCMLGAPWTIAMIQRWEMRHSIVGSDRMKFVGSALGLLGQYLIVLLLSCVTCGIYSAWGTVRINKYIYSHTHVEK